MHYEYEPTFLGRRGSGVQIAPPRPNFLLIPKELIDRRSHRFRCSLPLGLTPKLETLAIGTACRERNCEWQRSERQEGIPKHFGRWLWSGSKAATTSLR